MPASPSHIPRTCTVASGRPSGRNTDGGGIESVVPAGDPCGRLGWLPMSGSQGESGTDSILSLPGRPRPPGRKSEHRNRERGRTNNEHAKRNQVNRPEYEWPRYQADRSSVFSPPFADRRSPGHLGDCSAAERTNHRRRTTPEPAVARRAQRVRQMDFLHRYLRQQQLGRTQPHHRSGAVDVHGPACR